MKNIKVLFFMLALLVCSSSSFAGVVVTTSPGTYFYNPDADCGGCFLTGKCYDVVVTPGKVIETGSINGDYHVEATEDHFEIIIYDGVNQYLHQVTSLDQVLELDGSRSFTYELAE